MPILTPRDWQAIALKEATDCLGTPKARAKLVEANRYGALADELDELHRTFGMGLVQAHEEIKALKEKLKAMCDLWDSLCSTKGWHSPDYQEYRAARKELMK